MERARREHEGLVLFPLAWVSHCWPKIIAVFADLRHFPRRQVFLLRKPGDLIGFHEAGEFDFARTRFPRRSSHRHHRDRSRKPALAVMGK